MPSAVTAVLTSSDLWRRILHFQCGCPHAYLAFVQLQHVAVDPTLATPCAIQSTHSIHRIVLSCTSIIRPFMNRNESLCSLLSALPYVHPVLLWTAAACGDVSMVLFLLENRPQRPSPTWIPVTLAAWYRQLNVLKALYKIQFPGFTPTALETAAGCGHKDIVCFLNETCHNECSTPGAFDAAAANGHLELVQYLWNSGGFCSKRALDSAAVANHIETVEFLLEHGAPCSSSAVDKASRAGHLEVVKILTLAGKPATKLALDWAAEGGHVDVMAFLIANRTEGCTANALLGAAKNGHLEAARILLAALRIERSNVVNAAVAAQRHGFDQVAMYLQQC
ncbi:hypothetical protein Ae201684P_022279 [Aphanomyces euteiches]|uniref:Uncharacterized protein n=1 Tax=Aphanomyces euteiches TaxID=100861 RepID=A0A6G0X6K9_9STRA|nr:hypothetical protein Ae201684_007921 [Aphanomyces euteiches]KAH9074472.1 hypothetical protein Ae201684P_022279 [Aphanomyces euteiches]